jgi:ribonuclease HI
MPWKIAKLRGQRVYVKALPSGELESVSGRVEVRYKPNDGRSYRAAAANIDAVESEILPEETCGPAEAPAEKSDGEKKKPTRTTKTSESASLQAIEGLIVAYTDGACSGNPGPAGSGMLLQAGDIKFEGYTYLGTATNNVAELTAIQEAVRAVSSDKSLRVFTDSQYAIGVLQKGWKAKANQTLIAEIKALLKGRSVELVYVRGHAGDPGNERADELARLAIEVRASKALPKTF